MTELAHLGCGAVVELRSSIVRCGGLLGQQASGVVTGRVDGGEVIRALCDVDRQPHPDRSGRGHGFGFGIEQRSGDDGAGRQRRRNRDRGRDRDVQRVETSSCPIGTVALRSEPALQIGQLHTDGVT
ncbi:MAG TPA: hypothetical protein PLX07_09710, partial [Microthrixaceae bacterium]|nr:hypothetical protein [Microthrixaceae bacterium]